MGNDNCKSSSGEVKESEPERYLRETSSWHENENFSAVQDYHRNKFLVLALEDNNKTKLTVYDTESETEEVKILDTPEPLNKGTSITPLPNGELFCFGNYPLSGVALIIDSNCEFRILPSGTPCYESSGIYLNSSVYCFGGQNYPSVPVSSKFDLIENQWINLSPMPQNDWCCHSVMFNEDIMISGWENKNLMLYSVNGDSFSTIPYQFQEYTRKILINLDRLYLIECFGDIYESEVGDAYNWKFLSESIILSNCPAQLYWSYNKGGVYIAAVGYDADHWYNYYCKFDLNHKAMIKKMPLDPSLIKKAFKDN